MSESESSSSSSSAPASSSAVADTATLIRFGGGIAGATLTPSGRLCPSSTCDNDTDACDDAVSDDNCDDDDDDSSVDWLLSRSLGRSSWTRRARFAAESSWLLSV